MTDLTRFDAHFTADPWATRSQQRWDSDATQRLLGCEPHLFTTFVSQVAQSSYNGGLLRFLIPGGVPDLIEWNRSGWSSHWPSFRDHIVVFGYDWMGSQVGFDLRRRQSGEPLVAILEPGTGKLLTVPRTFGDFITVEVVAKPEAALALELYVAWREAGGAAPKQSECVGYGVPLFLGGADEPENLEMWDLDVYLALTGQAWAQARRLKPGTRIREIRGL